MKIGDNLISSGGEFKQPVELNQLIGFSGAARDDNDG